MQTWIYAATTPKLCQDRKVAAIRDACSRRSLRVPLFLAAAVAMAGLGDIVKKAFYLGVGVVATAGQRASGTLGELREQAQKLADEMVAKGEITTDEARRMVDEMVNRAQQQQPIESSTNAKPAEPRRIEIVAEDDDRSGKEPQDVDNLRKQVMQLKEELNRLKQD